METKPIFNHTGHIKLWNAIIDELKRIKKTGPENRTAEYQIADIKDDAYFEAFGKDVQMPLYVCFACEYDNEVGKTAINRCKNCPLNWPKSGTGLNCCIDEDYEDGLYDLLADSISGQDYDDAIRIAEEIRDASVKEGVVCE